VLLKGPLLALAVCAAATAARSDEEAPTVTSGLFRPWIARDVGSRPEVAGIGDLNGDGRNDVVVVTGFSLDPATDWTAHVLLQQPGGLPQVSVKYPLGTIGGSGCQSVDVGDVSGDARADVVVATSNGIAVLVQNATGTLDPPVLYPTPDADQLKIGDFNHDGRKDVASIGWGGPDVSVRLQNAGGTLEPPTAYPAPHGGYDELEAGDLNDDGRDDLAVMSGQFFAYDNLTVLLQSPSGGFLPASFYDLGGNLLTEGVEIVDVNGDGRRDAILSTGSTTSGSLEQFLQDASGALAYFGGAAVHYAPSVIESSDFNGDGRPDLAVLHENATLGVLLGTNAGLVPETLDPIPYVSYYQPQGLALGDLNQDGKPDAAIADPNVGLVVLYQKMPRDLGLFVDGMSWMQVGSDIGHALRVTNHGLATATGVTITSTLAGGVAPAAYVVPGCTANGNTVTCALPDIPPGETRSVDVVLTGLFVTTQASHAVTVTSDQPDGLPEDNTRTIPIEVAPGGCQARLYRGGFEGVGPGDLVWTQSSTLFGTPVCSTSTCFPPPTAGPRTFYSWAWFGRNGGVDQGRVSQRVVLPFGAARLRFYLWIGDRSGNGTDALRALVDGTPVFTATEAAPGYGSYSLVEIDVSAWADGALHEVSLDAQTFGPGITNFSVDDVSVQWCPMPRLAIADVVANEGGPGHGGSASFALTLDHAGEAPITVAYTTAAAPAGPGATPGADFVPVSGTLTLPAGATAASITVPLIGDAADEPDETFAVRLSALLGATFADAESVGTIDDDDGPTVTIGDVTVMEGPPGPLVYAQFPLTLSWPSVQTVRLDWSTNSGTALEGVDYISAFGTLFLDPGETEATLSVTLLLDTIVEPTEFFTVDLSYLQDVVPVGGNAVGRILDDDGVGPDLRGELAHGASREGTLAAKGAAAARDLYVLSRPPRTSFEVIVDAASGDTGTVEGPRVRRLHAILTEVAQESVPVGSGPARAIRVENATPWLEADYIEVVSAGCTSDCGADDTYRIRSRETTARIPRFNNTAGQVTVLVLQNAGSETVSGTGWFFDPSGALLSSRSFTLPGRASLAIPLTSVVGSQQGSITVTHDGAYGIVTGKAVSIEPATGFSFDSMLEPKAR
jgi:hypothetical protein